MPVRFIDDKAQPVPQERSALEKAANLGAAYVQGRTLGTGPKIAAGVGSAVAYPFTSAIEYMSGQPVRSFPEVYKGAYEMYSAPVEKAREDNPLLAGIAELGGGLKTGASIAKTAPAKSLASGIKNITAPTGQGMLPSAVSLAKKSAVGGLLGEAGYRGYSAATAEPGEEVSTLLEPSITPGGMLGAGLPVAGAVVGAGVSAVKPQLDQASKAAAKSVVDLAKKHGIDMRVSDIAGSGRYKRMISQGQQMPLSGAEDAMEKTQLQINRAVTKTLGEEADKITPEYLEKVRKTLGNDFQSLTRGKEFQVPGEVYTKIDEMANIASRKGYGMEGEALFKQYYDELMSLADDRGVIKGDKLDKFRRDLADVSRRQANSDIGQVASDFEDAVVDIISDSDPDVLKKITDMKYKYKNYKTVLSPAARNQATGDINPANLATSVQRVWGLDKFATGRAGDLGDIARIGQAMRLPSSSGTAENVMAQRSILEHALRLPQYGGNMLLQQYNRNPANVERLIGSNLPAVYSPMLTAPSVGAGIGSAQINQMLGGQ